MAINDLFLVTIWWLTFFVIGSIFIPFTIGLFKNFFDKGYIFSKVIGMVFVSYVVFILGIFHIAPFTLLTILAVAFIFLIINLVLFKRNFLGSVKQKWHIFLFEEIIFFIGILFWSFVRAHNPDIHGLEKFMDFGFINSALRTEYFPPKDMWFTPFSINYYYFGHIITAVLTKISFIPSYTTYNLMLATMFSFTFTCSFSIGANLIHKLNAKRYMLFTGGLLTAFLVSLSGNLHAIYAFFQKYPNDSPVPFWNLVFSPFTFPNEYWYPNATRFIYNTIHEFPSYSFVVSDLHGHVLDIPIVLLTIALLLSVITKSQITNHKSQINSNNKNVRNSKVLNFGNWRLFGAWNFELGILLLGFLLAVMYMTNAWDGLIYLLLAFMMLTAFWLNSVYFSEEKRFFFTDLIKYLIILVIGFVLFSIPFSLNFKPFASGIGVICPPEFLVEKGQLGPFLFESDHCRKSPWWQILTLHGFFYFFIISFLVFLYHNVVLRAKSEGPKILRFAQNDIMKSDIFVLILITLSTILVIAPEFVYLKDIYPAHYRANTMFKLTYQEFIMLSIVSSYVFFRIILNAKNKTLSASWRINLFSQRLIILGMNFVFFIFSILFFILVMIYPFSAVSSYYGNLQKYRGLDGTKYLKDLYPDDYQAISWINKNIKDQPIILEAQGDSYTDFARISSNTGLPTVLGWTVHEWLWRGSYDIPAPRINEADTLYNTKDINAARNLINKYRISYVYIGGLEFQKYPNLVENKFAELGKIVYQNNTVRIYRINLPQS